MTIAQALRDATLALGPTSSTARLDAELLMAAALGVSRSDLILRHMRDPVPAGFAPLMARRASHEPVAYILGATEFYGLPLIVSPAVLIPRGDSETMVDVARTCLSQRPPARVLDCGTGSGALLLATLSLFPQAQGVGIDRSADALEIAGRNAQALGLSSRVQLLERDWDQPGWAADLGRFDLILTNPPYVEDDAEIEPVVRDHEPAGALFAGPEGLDAYRILVPQLPTMLMPGGLALVEIGSRQAKDVAAIGQDAGFADILHHDLAGRPRIMAFST